MKCLLPLAAVLASGGCRGAASPDAAFQQIREEMRRGQLDAALHDADQALSKYQAKNLQWAARFRVQKAHILMIRGSYAQSLQLLDQPLPPDLSRTDTEVQKEMVHGLDQEYLQKFDAADQSLSQADALAAAIDSSLRGSVAQARGMLELNRRDYGKATVAFRAAADFARRQNLPAAELNALASLGNVAMGQEHYDEAIDRFRAALERSRALNAIGPESKSLGNLGWSYWVIGDFDSAVSELTLAEEKAAQAGLEEDRTYWLVALADVEAMQRRFAEADSTARKALALAENHDDKSTLSACLNVLSRIAVATDHLDDAGKFNRRALDIANSGSDQFLVNYARLIAGLIEAGQGHYPAAEAAYQKVLRDPEAATPHKWEAHARLAEVFAAQHQAAKAEHEFSVAIRTIQAARDSIQSNDFRVSFLSSAIEFYDEYVNFLIAQKRPLDALRIADLSRAQALEQSFSIADRGTKLKEPRPLNPRDTARKLHATLLFFWLGQQKSWLWVITPSRTSLVPLPASGELAALVKSYRDSFIDPHDPLESENSDGRKLYSALIAPAENRIPKNGRVVILPDGSLNSLNFETLIVPAHSSESGSVVANSETRSHYWIEDQTVLTANSLWLLSHSSNTAPPKTGNLLLMGDALAASPDFPPLPQSGKELSLLENYFAPAQRLELTGQNATATRFLSSQPEKFSFLHFATHGTASRLRPLESAVILSPDGDSYKLYARDVLKHPLNAYLVTISACNGAGTKTYAGEGLVGLSWAFLRAGAHNVIAGLWEVSNASTPQLMDELYKGLHAGQDPATALRNAKLTLVHSTGNYRKPFYWAPFLLYSGS